MLILIQELIGSLGLFIENTIIAVIGFYVNFVGVIGVTKIGRIEGIMRLSTSIRILFSSCVKSIAIFHNIDSFISINLPIFHLLITLFSYFETVALAI